MICEFCCQDIFAEITADIHDHLGTCAVFPEHAMKERIYFRTVMEYKLRYGLKDVIKRW